MATPGQPADVRADTVTAYVTPVTASRKEMCRLSRAVEDRAAGTSEPRIVLANLQQRERFTPAVARRYAALATDATLVGIFARDLPTDPAPRVSGYPLRPDDPATAEWTVILITSTRADGIFAHTAHERDSYQVAICNNREPVLAAARSLIERMQVHDP